MDNIYKIPQTRRAMLEVLSQEIHIHQSNQSKTQKVWRFTMQKTSKCGTERCIHVIVGRGLVETV